MDEVKTTQSTQDLMRNNKSLSIIVAIAAVIAGITGLVIVASVQNSRPNSQLVTDCGSSKDTIEEVFRGDFGTTQDGTPINSDGIPVKPDGRCMDASAIKAVYRRVPRQEYLAELSKRFGYIYSDDFGLTREGRKYEFGEKLWGKGVPGVVVNGDAPTRNHD